MAANTTFVLRTLSGLAIAGTIAFASVAARADQPINVFMDHARILKLGQPVGKVVIGNPKIADVTVADPKTIVLTGKAFGTTNLVILGKNGDALVDESVLVSTDEDHTIRVYRQTNRTVLSCGPNCEVNTQN